ncbi:hypothetical protein GQX73_g9848 [Xylaria multiplex]|uniref:non-specific serine/threonine protein kinase n=1 Tax=Xylaria multiplex TaxID=323545 RepID=A0A7C8MN91_9PEZI|nr:hypothetical protein GQX73_g9848 [Xylaria multiplex]
MADQSQSKIIEDNPIGDGLDTLRTSFSLTCEDKGLSYLSDSLDQLGQKDLQNLAIPFLVSLWTLPASGLLLSKTGRGPLQDDLLRLICAVASDDFGFDCIKPLLSAALADKPDDALIWNQVYHAIAESTPPPKAVASSLQQTSSLTITSQYRKQVDDILERELGPIVAGLKIASKAVFEKCTGGSNPIFRIEEGWQGWPKNADPDGVFGWLADLSDKLAVLAEDQTPIPSRQRRPLVNPNKHIESHVGKRGLSVGFVDEPKSRKDPIRPQILVPGELRSNRFADNALEAWLDLGRYARNVFATQNTRRFTLGFTICGSFMRVWEFDRLGGIASEEFNINKEGLVFVFTILGFLWMNGEELGFDPTIRTENGQQVIKIKRNGSTERLIIDEIIKRADRIAGRATTCWKAHHEEEPQRPLVIKDSWQYPEDDEGEFLREATSRNIVNVSRYYYHETIYINGKNDIQYGIRKGLDTRGARDYRPERLTSSPNTSSCTNHKVQRLSSQTSITSPRRKRPRLAPLTKVGSSASPNRVHRRVILRDYGKPIYEASSLAALLSALEGCIDGHESLYKVGILHRDISIYNLMINEDNENPSWPSFLIDLDLAIEGVAEEGLVVGTRAFMAIGVLYGETHTFMHDLESFFWVLFWLCIHYNGPGKHVGQTEFHTWNHETGGKLADLKKGMVSDEGDFIRMAEKNFTPYYQPLVIWANKLRRKVFPDGKRWKWKNLELYSSMREILREAQEDPTVLGVY